MSVASAAGNARTGGPRGPYRNGVRTRQQILDTAVQVFGQFGYAGGSLRRIAEAVGVSTPALIRHFGSKEGLFTAVLEHSDASSWAATQADAAGLEHVRLFADAPTTNVHNRGLVELLLTVATEASDPAHPARPFMVERYRALVQDLDDALRAAGEAGELRPMTDREREAEARGLVALMDGLELQWLLDPGMDLVGTYRHHFERMLARWGHDAGDAGAAT
jgi:AcrR family transcriptional regulator